MIRKSNAGYTVYARTGRKMGTYRTQAAALRRKQQLEANVAELGLDEGDILYWCCQSLFKYLPQYDRTFAEIALAVPKARFLFIAHKSAAVTAPGSRVK